MPSMETGAERDARVAVGRFAPTPSGRMHLGNVFSLLMAWLGARSAGGGVVLRIEDLDPRARGEGAVDLLLDDLEWLGLTWDEGPFRQSDRTGRYEEALSRLRDAGLTYPCFCTRAELHAATAPHASDGTYVYQGTCRDLSPDEVAARSRLRPPATRLRVPEAGSPDAVVRFRDLVAGPREEDLARACGDFVVRRSDGVFAYQLAVVVDDAEMGVGQVVRGRDLMGSVARQAYLQDLLGYPRPDYAHVPLLVAADGRRLAKRDRDLDMGAIRARAGRPGPVIGLLAALAGILPDGASPDDDLTPDDLLATFSWEAISRLPPAIVVGEPGLPGHGRGI